MSTKITSCGIIRDAELPRVGVMNFRDGFEDYYQDAISLTWMEIEAEIRAELAEKGYDADELDEQVDEVMRDIEVDSETFLVGDWHRVGDKFEIDHNGKNGFAATYNTDSGVLCIEWSTATKQCHHTSPCYVMADGRGPCGDLDTAGDSVLAYCLPE